MMGYAMKTKSRDMVTCGFEYSTVWPSYDSKDCVVLVFGENSTAYFGQEPDFGGWWWW